MLEEVRIFSHERIMIKKITDWHVVLLFGLFFICETILLSPFGNFPLHDDWVPSLSIFEYVRSGVVFYPALLAASSVVPILYGIGTSLVFGFSFVALRLTSVVLAWGCACFLYAFLRKNDFPRPISIAATALLLASPLFINLSYTFMSEIPALFFLLGAIFFFSWGLREKNYGVIGLGALFGTLGFFTRQTDIFIILSAAAVYFFDKSLDRRRGLLIFGLCGIAIVTFGKLLQGAGISPSALSVFYLPTDILLRVVRTFLFALFFLALAGLAVLPATVSIWMRGKKISDARLSGRLIFFSVVASVSGAVGFILFNQFENVITLYGVGPVPFVMIGSIKTWGPIAAYVAVTGMAIVSGVYLLRCYVKDAGIFFGKRPWNAFIWYYAALYFLFVSIVFPWFDRYYILLLPLSCYCAAQILERYSWRPRIFYAIIACMGLYGMIGTYNYLAWNDARWRLGERLITKGVAPSELSGGKEWNGWYHYKNELDPLLKKHDPRENAAGFIDDFLILHRQSTYILSFSPVEDTAVVDTENVAGIFSNIDKIYALKKIEPKNNN